MPFFIKHKITISTYTENGGKEYELLNKLPTWLLSRFASMWKLPTATMLLPTKQSPLLPWRNCGRPKQSSLFCNRLSLGTKLQINKANTKDKFHTKTPSALFWDGVLFIKYDAYLCFMLHIYSHNYHLLY